ncbi:murein biosynthesis integral membrane protein MurJ [Flagellimonas marinaquae]|uniref:murein biosynthesis integral membrane protein MurJ n=1 Tax=Flagellimonas marinaquae TaxID=254955 RepID=UPI002075E17C|nr:lipid II flippase MurJ [Allomuricauda aquimarina]USD24823.1 polysaccharide biosynthesis C-terminal domain-containing protein [Allomuricauda aquimarina]
MFLSFLKTGLHRIKGLAKQPLVLNFAIVGGLTVLMKLLGFYKETIVASTFGLSELLDTFLIAMLIPTFVQNVFINALKNIFIPNYIIELKNGNKPSHFQSIVFIVTAVFCVVFCLLIVAFSDVFLDLLFPNHEEGYYSLIRKQLYIILPCIFFWGFSTLLNGLLEISNRYFLSSVGAFFQVIAIIVCLSFFKEQMGNMVLAIATLIGSFLSFIFVLIVALTYKEIKLSTPKLNSNSRLMIRQLPPKISSGLLAGLNNFVDQFFAAQLVVGSLSAINYGIKIPSFTISILMIALGKVLLPHFSRQLSDNTLRAYSQLFKMLKLLFLWASVLVIIGTYFSSDIIRILFERNAFGPEDTKVVANIQIIALIYIPFHICTLVLSRFLTSINKNTFMAWTSLFWLIGNIILNSLLIKPYGVYGLVMATTIIYIINSSIYMFYTYKQYSDLIKTK